LGGIIIKEHFHICIRIFCEFSIEEKITDHFIGIENFVKQAPREFINSYKYFSIDPIKNDIKDTKQLYRSITLFYGSYYQYKEEIIYVYDKPTSQIHGIYLNAFKYFGFNVKEITSFFAENINNKTIDLDGLIYQSYYKQFPDFDQLKRSIVLFLD
jgi:hypothetical protein